MPYSDEELLADIRAVADVVERSPSLPKTTATTASTQ